ncbi:MAG TPA: phosphoenolpyruvate carboxylase [Pirellulaceae bacterium]|nr:phosphoenolpyruvate carboxylase [Pirellulaceae bacterium]
MLDDQLRGEVRWLGELLGNTIAELAQPNALDLVERVRELAKSRRAGNAQAETDLLELIPELSPSQVLDIVRAFSIFFDLANLAEDRHRARVLRQREAEADPAPRGESIGAAVAEMQRQGFAADQVQALLHRLTIEPVFTAHPTEAKRRSLREKIRDFRHHLNSLDDERLTPRERRHLVRALESDLTMMWQTDLLRERRPTVLEELERSLFFFETLWNVVPDLYSEFEEAVAEFYPAAKLQVPTFLRFATWIGGDRDGNPNVTWQITSEAIWRLRQVALHNHYLECRRLRRELSISSQQVPVTRELVARVAAAWSEWPEVERLTQPIAPAEWYRRFLRMVQWRLERTRESEPFQPLPAGAYRSATEFASDLKLLRDSLARGKGGDRLVPRVDRWLRQAAVFGFHAMRMDVRQESSWYVQVVDELMRKLGLNEHYAQLEERARQAILNESMGRPFTIDVRELSQETAETLQLFRLLAETARFNGAAALGCHIISMTKRPSDVLSVLWLSRWAAKVGELSEGYLPMPIVPLLETIDDLQSGPEILDELLRNADYAEHVHRCDQQQIVMIGYSDSTKDGGYLAAAWAQYQGQVAVSAVGTKHGVRIIFFHGRGGALGRGGGPAARSVLSSPRGIINGAMRLTEQGEVLSARYDDPQIAKRHLEQLISATILVSSQAEQVPHTSWLRWMEELAQRALVAYRQLVESPGFLTYFDQATPISEIERLPIGSRPPRRAGERSLDKLRAIPWVFAWTQNRHLLPAWYGVGAALHQFIDEHAAGDNCLQEMYDQWPFFQGLIDNAALALAKSDMGIARVYAALATDAAEASSVFARILFDHTKSCDAIRRITRREHLLDQVPWLRESIETRNPYVDPLNLIQICLLQQRRASQVEQAATEEVIAAHIRLSIQGIAAGLRTTG